MEWTHFIFLLLECARGAQLTEVEQTNNCVVRTNHVGNQEPREAGLIDSRLKLDSLESLPFHMVADGLELLESPMTTSLTPLNLRPAGCDGTSYHWQILSTRTLSNLTSIHDADAAASPWGWSRRQRRCHSSHLCTTILRGSTCVALKIS